MANFERQHLHLCTHIEQTALIEANYTEFSKQGWFLYFWKEARQTAGMEARAPQILAFFNDLFKLPKEWDRSDPGYLLDGAQPFSDYRGDVAAKDRVKRLEYKVGKTWDNVDDTILYNLLNACLQVGFERIRTVKGGKEIGELSADNAFAFARHTLILDSDHEYTLGWRGDGRNLGQIGAAGGFLSKAQSEVKLQNGQTYAESIGLREKWNPFSKPENRTDYYYRKMQQDNCLHTVVSVTLDFVTAATFPKLEDLLGSLLGGGTVGPNATIEGLPSDSRKKLSKVVTTSGEVYRYADRQQLYLVVLFGKFLDTQKRQKGDQQGESAKSFPEVAVKKIPVNNIFGSLSFVRVFDGLQEDQGFTAYYDAAKSVWPTMDRCLAFAGDQAIARQLFPLVQDEFKKISSSMPFHARWTGTGGQKFGTPLKIWQVMKGGQLLYGAG